MPPPSATTIEILSKREFPEPPTKVKSNALPLLTVIVAVATLVVELYDISPALTLLLVYIVILVLFV